MTNRTQAFNLRNSARITDPNTFPRNAPYVARFQPHTPEQALGYICSNVLPTAEGYQSFFGTRQQMGNETLPEQTYDMFTFYSPTGDVFALALTSQTILAQTADFAPTKVLVDGLDGSATFDDAEYGVGV